MYYLHVKGGVPTPAEAPHACGRDGFHEWSYGKRKHQDALEHVKSTVDHLRPIGHDGCLNPTTVRTQVRTREFVHDQRRAEIGRSNRKLVDRLASISRGCMGPDPRAPPSAAALSKASSLLLCSSAMSAARERVRSLTQQGIAQDNAGLVRRILAVDSQFDRKADARDFQKHQRASLNLQRLPQPDAVSRVASQPKSLPPLRHPRPSSNSSTPLQGLEDLLLPGDLRRSTSSPGFLCPWTSSSLEQRRLEDRARPLHASAPLRTQPTPLSNSDGASAGWHTQPLQCRSEPPPEGFESGPLQEGAEWPQRDDATERRRWLPGSTDADAVQDVAADDGEAGPVEEAQFGSAVGPCAAAPVTEPRAATLVTEPRAATFATESRAATPVTEPRAATPVTEPRAATPVSDPRAATPTAEPRKGTPEAAPLQAMQQSKTSLSEEQYEDDDWDEASPSQSPGTTGMSHATQRTRSRGVDGAEPSRSDLGSAGGEVADGASSEEPLRSKSAMAEDGVASGEGLTGTARTAERMQQGTMASTTTESDLLYEDDDEFDEENVDDED